MITKRLNYDCGYKTAMMVKNEKADTLIRVGDEEKYQNYNRRYEYEILGLFTCENMVQ